jgi:dipeptidyl aminopeptidase/acylaminoacyl peptidase
MTKIRLFIASILGSIALIALLISIILYFREYRLITAHMESMVASEIVPYPSPISQFSLSLTETSSSLLYPPSPSPLPPQPTQPPPPPLCQFKSDIALETQAASVANYSFSEPRIVRESSQNIEIVEWLPDNQQVLITQEEFPLQNIELFEPETKEVQTLATRRIVHTPPVWLPTLNAVLYTEMNIIDATKQPVLFTRQLWVSQKDTREVHKISDEISSFNISADPKSDRFTYQGTKQLFTHSPKSDSTQMVAIDPLQWTSPAEPGQDRSFDPPYNLAWRPGSAQIAFYSEKGLFLVDADTGEVCDVNLDGWTHIARWSPDGRYLAMVWSFGDLLHNPSELVVLDMETGKTYSYRVIPDTIGEGYVTDIVWAPDNRHLVTIGKYYPDISVGKTTRGLFLVDIIQGSSNSIESTIQLGGGEWGTNIAWSPDGSKLIIACPTEEVERLCLIDVQKKDSP